MMILNHNADRGHVMHVMKTYAGRPFKAAMFTPFINTTGRCLRLFYLLFHPASLSLQVTPGGFAQRWDSVYGRGGWQLASVRLPPGKSWSGQFLSIGMLANSSSPDLRI